MQWLKKMIAEAVDARMNDKAKALLSQISLEMSEHNARTKSLISRGASKTDFEWLNHELEEAKRTIDDLKNNMRARETFDWEVETRLAKLERV